MGIPYYFKKVTTHFPKVLSAKAPPCSRLFLDFNCAIHHCAHQIPSGPGFERRLIVAVIEYIELILGFVCPKDLLYIAMDGLAPRSKMVQQRKRRYLSHYVKQELAKVGCSSGDEWDSNAISPGTQFMADLADAIREHFRTKPIGFIMSDTLEVGEGEHKIFDYIHGGASPPIAPIHGGERMSNEVSEASPADVVYGLDADLIMLSMINMRSGGQIRLLREPVFYDMANNEPFLYMDVSMLATFIRDHLRAIGLPEGDGSVDPLMIYVFLCFFMGNDFVPNLSFLKLKEDGLEHLLMEYKHIVELSGEHILTRDESGRYQINVRTLWKLMERLSANEDEHFAKVHEDYMQEVFRSRMRRGGKHDKKKEAEELIQAWPLLNKINGAINPRVKGWRLEYYHQLFDISHDIINDACSNYIQGLYWLIDCYFHHTPHRGWYYKHSYSPTALDLFNYITTHMNNLQKPYDGDNDVVDDVNLQLLCILPPSSMHLLKPEYRHICTSLKSGCLHMFPNTFGVQGHLKRFLWECHPMLPVPHIPTLKKAMTAL